MNIERGPFTGDQCPSLWFVTNRSENHSITVDVAHYLCLEFVISGHSRTSMETDHIASRTLLSPDEIIRNQYIPLIMSGSVIDWLLRNSGPVVRFRTIVDLLQTQDVGLVATAIDSLHGATIVKIWLDRLKQQFDVNSVWSEEPTAFGNIIGKLVDLGLRAGLQPFDTLTLPARAWLTDTIEASERPRLTETMLIVTCHLALAGYSDIQYVDKILKWRLNRLYQQHGEGGEWTERPNEISWFDVIGFLHSKPIMQDSELRQKVEAIMRNVVDNQSRLRLPEPEVIPRTLALLGTVTRSQTIRESSWFKNLIDAIESFKTERGTYRFPEEAMPEKSSGTWLDGSYLAMDHGANPNALEAESTLRALMLKQVIAADSQWFP